MTDLTAIDLALNPDETMLDRAKAVNAMSRAYLPSGFALDETHMPHVTVLQRYVRTDDLDRVFAAVEDVIAAKDVASLRLRALRLGSVQVAATPGIALGVVLIEPTPALHDLQAALIDAVAPYAKSGGTAAAYVTTPDEPDINADTLVHIDEYVPKHSGEHYVPHLTAGAAKEDFIKAQEAMPFEGFEFSPNAVAAYQLGNNGAARRVLKSWALQPA
jgi:2'-5' RNA ligase superfamily protein